jgi:hypothetical protein
MDQITNVWRVSAGGPVIERHLGTAWRIILCDKSASIAYALLAYTLYTNCHRDVKPEPFTFDEDSTKKQQLNCMPIG